MVLDSDDASESDKLTLQKSLAHQNSEEEALHNQFTEEDYLIKVKSQRESFMRFPMATRLAILGMVLFGCVALTSFVLLMNDFSKGYTESSKIFQLSNVYVRQFMEGMTCLNAVTQTQFGNAMTIRPNATTSYLDVCPQRTAQEIMNFKDVP